MALKFLNNGYFAGKVGIGIQNPTVPLDVSGVIKTTTSFVGNAVIINQVTAATSSGRILFKNNSGSDKMAMEDNGNFGIGTTSPNQLLELKKTSGTVTARLHADHESSPATGIEFMRGTSDTWGGDAYTDWKIGNGSTQADFAITSKDSTRGENERVTIEYDTGNVGIGTSSPNANLDILNGTTGASLKLSATSTAYWQLQRDPTTGNLNISDDGIGNVMSLDQVSGNVGIGTTSPSRNLEVSGVGTGDHTYIKILGDTAKEAILELHADNNASGDRWRIASGNSARLDFRNNGSTKVSFQGGGNVGIGTTAPSQKLHVVGNARVTGAYYDSNNSPGTANQVLVSTATGTDWVDASGSSIIGGPYLPLTAGSTKPLSGNLHFSAAASYMFGGDDEILAGQDGSGYYYATGNGQDLTKPVFIGDNNAYIRFKSGNSERMRITNTGNVGIGTTSPSQKLEVNGAVLAGDYRGSAQIYLTSPDSWIFRSTGGSERMRITSAGNVGINTTSPLTKLQITAANASSPTANIFLDIDGSNTPGMGGQIIFGASTSGTLTDYIARIQGVRSALDNGSSDLHFQTTHVSTATGPTTKMTILSDGNVGIGTTAPNYVLDISKDNASILNLHRPNSSTAAASFLDFSFNTANATEAVYARIRSDVEVNTNSAQGGDLSFHTANAGTVGEVMRLTQEGNVGIGATNPLRKLHVVGQLAVNNATTEYYGVLLQGGQGADPSVLIGDWHNSSGTIKWDSSGNYLRIDSQHSTANAAILFSGNDAATEYMRITSGGNVGIGTTSPDTKLDIEDSNPFVTIQGSSSSYVNAGVQFISNQASTTRGLGNFYYSAHSDVEWFSGLPYNGNDAFVINRNTNYTVPSSQSSPPGIGASAGTLLKIDSAGAIRFNNYSGTNKIGTPTYILGTDASGNVVKVLGSNVPGSVSGSGTLNTVAMWTPDGDTLGNSPITISGNNATFAGEITATNIYAETYRSSRADGEIYIQAATASDFVSIGTQVANNLMRIQGNGNVGIGTTAPEGILQISKPSSTVYDGTSDSGQSNIGASVTIQNTNTTVNSFAQINMQVSASSNRAVGRIVTIARGNASSDMAFVTESFGVRAEKMRIDQTGNVGIGTTSPSTKLHVDSSTAFSLTSVAGDTLFLSDDTNPSALNGVGASIGFSGPQEVQRQAAIAALRTGSDHDHIGLAFYTHPGTSNDETIVEQMRITDSGNVGIGATSPGAKLHVLQPGNGTSNLIITEDNARKIKIGRDSIQCTDLSDSGTNLYLNQGGGNVSVPNSGLVVGATGNTYKFEVHSGATNVTSMFKSTDNQAWISIQDDDSGTYGALIGIDSDESENFVVANASVTKMLSLSSAGSFKLHNYNSTNKTGTPTYLLGTDASGNVVKTNTVPGSAAGPYLPLAGSVYDGNTGSWSNGITGNLALVSTSGTKGIIIGDEDNGAGQLFVQFNSSNGGGILTNNGGNLEITAQNYGDGSDIIFKGNDTNNNIVTYFQTVGASQKVRFLDNIKLTIGNGDDLQIYHDGSNSYIRDQGSGNLIITGSQLTFSNVADTEYMVKMVQDGTVELYYNGSKKLETTSAGVTVTGSLVVSNDITATGDLDVRDIDARNLTLSGKGTSAATITSDGSSTLTTKGYVNSLITGATIYRGTWDPDVSLNSGYGNPNLNTVTQTSGYYYICSADGAATPNGTGNEPDSWNTGDWVIWNDDIGTGEWQKIDNSSVLSGVGTGQTVALWQGASSVTDSETLGNAPITVSGNNATFGGSVGIGSSPSDKLTVSGSGNFGIKIDNSSNTSSDYSAIRLIQDSAEKGVIYTNQEDLYLRSPSGDVLLQHSGGNVGIGTTSPDTKLHVEGDLMLDVYNNGGSGNGIFFREGYGPNDANPYNISITIFDDGDGSPDALDLNAFDGIYFNTGSGTRQNRGYVDLSGNWYLANTLWVDAADDFVGIGTTTPGAQFNVQGTSTIGWSNLANARILAGSVNSGIGIDSNEIVSKGENLYIGTITSGTDVVMRAGGATSRLQISGTNGNVGIGTTSPVYKLDVNGGVQAGGKVTYTKSAGSLNTTGYAVAGLTTSSNGQSAGFTFTCFGHTGGYQKIVYSCYNGSGTWVTKKVINEGTNQLDVVASANGTTITFTFKSISGTMSYTPRVTVEAVGTAINSTYA